MDRPLDLTDPVRGAHDLIGWTLLVDGVGGPIVEAEAYHEREPASHSFGGMRTRNAAMFGPPGTLYVYLSYGIHWCVNIVCGRQGEGAGVLIRALEPEHGLDEMRRRRGGIADVRLLASGPGRVGQALGVGPQMAGLPADLRPPERSRRVVSTPRIGITKAADHPWRFLDPDSPYVSRRPPSPRRAASSRRARGR